MFGRPLTKPAELAQNNVSQNETVLETDILAVPEPETEALAISDSNVLGSQGETKQGDLDNQDIFTSNTDALSVDKISDTPNSQSVTATAESNVVERVIANPSRIMALVYLLLGILVFISLVLSIFIEIRKQHARHIIYGVGVLALLLALLFIYRTFVFTQVLVL